MQVPVETDVSDKTNDSYETDKDGMKVEQRYKKR
jgi:hypothetical protein